MKSFLEWLVESEQLNEKYGIVDDDTIDYTVENADIDVANSWWFTGKSTADFDLSSNTFKFRTYNEITPNSFKYYNPLYLTKNPHHAWIYAQKVAKENEKPILVAVKLNQEAQIFNLTEPNDFNEFAYDLYQNEKLVNQLKLPDMSEIFKLEDQFFIFNTKPIHHGLDIPARVIAFNFFKWQNRDRNDPDKWVKQTEYDDLAHIFKRSQQTLRFVKIDDNNWKDFVADYKRAIHNYQDTKFKSYFKNDKNKNDIEGDVFDYTVLSAANKYKANLYDEVLAEINDLREKIITLDREIINIQTPEKLSKYINDLIEQDRDLYNKNYEKDPSVAYGYDGNTWNRTEARKWITKKYSDVNAVVKKDRDLVAKYEERIMNLIHDRSSYKTIPKELSFEQTVENDFAIPEISETIKDIDKLANKQQTFKLVNIYIDSFKIISDLIHSEKIKYKGCSADTFEISEINGEPINKVTKSTCIDILQFFLYYLIHTKYDGIYSPERNFGSLTTFRATSDNPRTNFARTPVIALFNSDKIDKIEGFNSTTSEAVISRCTEIKNYSNTADEVGNRTYAVFKRKLKELQDEDKVKHNYHLDQD